MSFANTLKFPRLKLPSSQVSDAPIAQNSVHYAFSQNAIFPRKPVQTVAKFNPSSSEPRATQLRTSNLEENAAAFHLGISVSLLRCYTQIYQRVGGRLVQGRYDAVTLLRFQHVLQRVQEGATVDMAMRESLQPVKASTRPNVNALKAANKQLSAELNALRSELEKLKENKRKGFWN